MVFQRFNLFPHMTALENIIEAPIHVRGMPRDEAIEMGRALLDARRARGQGATSTRRSSRAASSSGSRSRGRSR